MNVLIIGKRKLKEHLSNLDMFKDHYHLDNFNYALSLVDIDTYDDIDNAEISYIENGQETMFDGVRSVLKHKRWNLIIIDLNIDNYEHITNMIPKFSKANINLLQEDKVKIIKYPYKLIPFGTLKTNLKEDKYLSYSLSLLLFDNLYHIDVKKAPLLYDMDINDKLTLLIKEATENPYNSKIHHLRLCFLSDFSFIDELYYYGRFSYLLDKSNDSIDDKIANISSVYDYIFIYDDDNVDKDNIKLFVKDRLCSNCVFIKDDINVVYKVLGV